MQVTGQDSNNIKEEIRVIHDDKDFLVIEKPSGIIVNKADTTRREETLQDWVIKNFEWATSLTPTSLEEDEKEFYSRSGIVHRLDKETSGIILIAKNSKTFQELKNQFKERKVEKTYIALAHGETQEEGEINVPVGRLPWNRKKFGVVTEGRDALTKYKRLEVFGEPEKLSLLEMYPKTGRTHQLRVHLKYIGHPIFGDSLYAGRKVSRKDRGYLKRIFLHAKKISFTHPSNGSKLEFDTQLPVELSEFLNTLS